MLKPRKASTLEYLRRLAVNRLEQGYGTHAVADFLGVTARSVQRWRRARERLGERALAKRPHPGRPPKLSDGQTSIVLSWLDQSPCHFGFPTQRWTARRVAELIEHELGITMNRRYLSDWLRRRGITPQIPRRLPKERDEAQIAWWVAHLWPQIKKKRGTWTPSWFLSMKPGC